MKKYGVLLPLYYVLHFSPLVQTRKTMTSDESGMNFHKENPNSMEEHHNSDDENSNDRIGIE